MSNQTSNFQEPFIKFSQWLQDAKADSNIVEPTAMSLSTANEKGQPSSRMILLKRFDERGFCFFTNLTSRKANNLEVNNNVALCFYWGKLGRQVRIEGKVEKVSLQEADDYFASRRRGSQIGAWASKQSKELESDEEFANRIAEITKDFEGQEVPRPPFWSGFRVKPKLIEFWEEGEYRIHKRTVYTLLKKDTIWQIDRLYP
ncbi:MAG: pyridoxamine 5'-phosphate oxidase [Proteobacteria bacterium]|nr:pyridoxamine 5'-phosphate oxidase [Pseudomonadota bacterium]